MKLEIIKKEVCGEADIYKLLADGKFILARMTYDETLKELKKIKANTNLINPVETVLYSEEIYVSL